MLNRHKLQRKLKRSQRISRKSRDSVVYANKKDFAWRGKKKNPLRTESTKFSRKVKIELALFVLSVLGFFAILVLHPFFQIHDIRVNGTVRLNEAEVRDAVVGSLAFKRFFLLPGANYFFVQEDEVEDILSQRFPLNSVTVTKEFPSTLDVSVVERISTIVYDDGNMYYLMGTTGKIVEPIQKVPESEWHIETEIVTSTNERGEVIAEEKEISRTHTPDYHTLVQNVGAYPIMYNVDSQDRIENESDITTEVVVPEQAEASVTWYEELQRHAGLDPQYLVMNSPYDATYVTAGPDIHLSLVGEQGMQIERLRTALQHITSLSAVSYIDVRFDQRVYWR